MPFQSVEIGLCFCVCECFELMFISLIADMK